MTVCDPIIKDGLKNYVIYTIRIKNVDDPIYRRYSDFFVLRSKLVERWPAVYIPNIPPKKVMVIFILPRVILKLKSLFREQD